MDYLLFTYGLALLLLAAICLPKKQSRASILPWTWLGLFGLTQGVERWLEVLVGSAGDPPAFTWSRLVLLAVSYCFLVEFGRAAVVGTRGRPKVGRWVFVPLLMLVALGGLRGITGVDTAAHYVLALVGGLWSAGAMRQAYVTQQSRRRPLAVGSAALALYGVIAGLILGGISSYALQAVLVAVLLVCVYRTRRLVGTGSEEAETRTRRNTVWLALGLVLVLAMGLALTEVAGQDRMHQERSRIVEEAAVAAAGIDQDDLRRLTGSPVDLANPAYETIRAKLGGMQTASPDARWFYLVGFRGDETYIAVDSTPADSPDFVVPGHVYADAPAVIRRVFETGQPLLAGPYKDQWGVFYSGFAAVKHPISGLSLMVLGFDLDAQEIDRLVASYRLAPITITLLVALLLVGFFVLRQRLWASSERVAVSERLYRSMFEDNGAVMLLIDPDKATLVDANESAATFYGYSRVELRGLKITDVSAFPEQQVFENIESVVVGGQKILSTTHRLRSGETRQVEIHTMPLSFRGRPVLYSIITDVTERARLEEQFHQSQKMEAIGELAGGIAHDFNNLLTGILGHANMLRLESEPGSQAYDAAGTIEKAAERAAELTKQLLGFARRGKFLTVPVDVHLLVNEAAGLLSRSLDKRIVITLRLMAHHATVTGDPGQLQQMILNLAVNARDALPEGGEITLSTLIVDASQVSPSLDLEHAPDASTPYLALEVSDDGIGIPHEIQERIFEPFFTTKSAGKGTGMGLAMVYGIASNHGGAVRVSSKQGQGARFTVYLPLHLSPASTQSETGGKKPLTGTGHVLIVDDEPVVRQVAARMLRRLGYQVTEADGGPQALEVYREHHAEIDLVVMDMVMPEMSGRDCFRVLRTINPLVRALLSSGYGLDGVAQDTVDEGMIGFVQKPYKMEGLAEAIHRALEKPAGED